MSSIDRRDILPISKVGENAAKILRSRGDRAWRRAQDFEASPVRTQKFDSDGRGIGRTEYYVDTPDGCRQLTKDELDEGAAYDWYEIVESDPTGDAASEPRGRTRSVLTELKGALAAYETHAQRLVDLVDEITRTKTDIKPDDPRGWCPNCRAAGVTEPSAMRTDKKTKLQRYRDAAGRCRPCADFHAANSFERPALIIQRISEGRKLTEAETTEAIGRARRTHEIEQRKARTRVRSHRDGDGPTCPSTYTHDGVELHCEITLMPNSTHPGNHLAEHEGAVHQWANHVLAPSSR